MRAFEALLRGHQAGGCMGILFTKFGTFLTFEGFSQQVKVKAPLKAKPMAKNCIEEVR